MSHPSACDCEQCALVRQISLAVWGTVLVLAVPLGLLLRVLVR